MIKFARYLLPGIPRSPLYLIHFVTSKCMGKCLHCFYWREINRPENPLTPGEVYKVAAGMGPVLIVIFTGGEPYMRPDFDDVAEAFYKANPPLNLGIATSGFHTEKVVRSAERLIHNCPRSNVAIGLPIEGNEVVNDRVRGVPGFFKRTTETIRELNALKNSLSVSNKKRFSILVDMTMSAHNQDGFEDAYHYVRDVLKPDAINFIITRGSTRDPGAKDFDISKYERVNLELERDIKAGKWSGYSGFSRLLHAKDIILRRTGIERYRGVGEYYPCVAGSLIGVLGPEGAVQGCELLDSSFGNVRNADYDLPRLWRSKAADEFRSKIKSGRCQCFHQCFLSPSIFFNPRGFARIAGELLYK